MYFYLTHNLTCIFKLMHDFNANEHTTIVQPHLFIQKISKQTYHRYYGISAKLDKLIVCYYSHKHKMNAEFLLVKVIKRFSLGISLEIEGAHSTVYHCI